MEDNIEVKNNNADVSMDMLNVRTESTSATIVAPPSERAAISEATLRGVASTSRCFCKKKPANNFKTTSSVVSKKAPTTDSKITGSRKIKNVTKTKNTASGKKMIKKKKKKKKGSAAMKGIGQNNVNGETELCRLCLKSCMSGVMLTCSVCNMDYHLNCMDPPIVKSPRGKWTCPLHLCSIMEIVTEQPGDFDEEYRWQMKFKESVHLKDVVEKITTTENLSQPREAYTEDPFIAVERGSTIGGKLQSPSFKHLKNIYKCRRDNAPTIQQIFIAADIQDQNEESEQLTDAVFTLAHKFHGVRKASSDFSLGDKNCSNMLTELPPGCSSTIVNGADDKNVAQVPPPEPDDNKKRVTFCQSVQCLTFYTEENSDDIEPDNDERKNCTVSKAPDDTSEESTAIGMDSDFSTSADNHVSSEDGTVVSMSEAIGASSVSSSSAAVAAEVGVLTSVQLQEIIGNTVNSFQNGGSGSGVLKSILKKPREPEPVTEESQTESPRNSTVKRKKLKLDPSNSVKMPSNMDQGSEMRRPDSSEKQNNRSVRRKHAKHPDGKKHTKHPDGKKHTKHPDGKKHTKHPDGKRHTNPPDGRKHTNPPVCTKQINPPVCTKQINPSVCTKQINPPVCTKQINSPVCGKQTNPPADRKHANRKVCKKHINSPVCGNPVNLPVCRKQVNPPVCGKRAHPSVCRQPADPPVCRQPAAPPVCRQPAAPPVCGQPINPPLCGQPINPPVCGQPIDPPVCGKPSDPRDCKNQSNPDSPKSNKPDASSFKLSDWINNAGDEEHAQNDEMWQNITSRIFNFFKNWPTFDSRQEGSLKKDIDEMIAVHRWRLLTRKALPSFVPGTEPYPFFKLPFNVSNDWNPMLHYNNPIARVKAALCPLAHYGPIAHMYSNVLTIGVGEENDLCLSSYGECCFISEKHAVIMYDEHSDMYELINYSCYGTVVDQRQYVVNSHKSSTATNNNNNDGGEYCGCVEHPSIISDSDAKRVMYVPEPTEKRRAKIQHASTDATPASRIVTRRRSGFSNVPKKSDLQNLNQLLSTSRAMWNRNVSYDMRKMKSTATITSAAATTTTDDDDDDDDDAATTTTVENNSPDTDQDMPSTSGLLMSSNERKLFPAGDGSQEFEVFMQSDNDKKLFPPPLPTLLTTEDLDDTSNEPVNKLQLVISKDGIIRSEVPSTSSSHRKDEKQSGPSAANTMSSSSPSSVRTRSKSKQQHQQVKSGKTAEQKGRRRQQRSVSAEANVIGGDEAVTIDNDGAYDNRDNDDDGGAGNNAEVIDSDDMDDDDVFYEEDVQSSGDEKEIDLGSFIPTKSNEEGGPAPHLFGREITTTCKCQLQRFKISRGHDSENVGSAQLNHGSYIRFGCVEFVFSIVGKQTSES